MNLKTRLLQRIDQLKDQGVAVLSTSRLVDHHYGISHVDSPAMTGFRIACLSFIERVYGKSHPHFVGVEKMASGYDQKDAQAAIEILKAIRDEIDGDWLFSVRQLVSAELFSDFIDMATHLLEEGYKDAAAVMLGSVLEEHLRQLAIHNQIATTQETNDGERPLKTDRLNAELCRHSIYSKLDQKVITA